ncbi:MAG: ester cyclase [Lentisphaerae bacterium]|nr:ester cyclase [Lentisphaerota bacterium]MCP4103211.1 ester cyclase [Lentisphaerota bacterium]
MEDVTHKQILISFISKVWNNGDFNDLDKLITSQYKVEDDPYDPWNGQNIDKKTFIERVVYSRNAFPNLNFKIKEMIEENSTVAIRWIMSGTHKGDLPQMPATGNKFSIQGMTFYYFENDKICGHRQCFDQLGFYKQIKGNKK